MRKLIILGEQEHPVVCDNKACGYKVENPTKGPYYNIDEFLNVPCPKCGENLLTQEDLDKYNNFLRSVNFINKWFGWIAYFIPRSRFKNATYHTREGFKEEVKSK